MKTVLAIIILFIYHLGFAQDSTYRCTQGWVEVKRLGLGKVHSVQAGQGDKFWISGKVRRVDYEYYYRRTYNGSTAPAFPEEFYKPIKKKSFYYVPVSDIVIKYGIDGPVFQTFSIDSMILRSYLKNGTPRDVQFFNTDFVIDSLFRFYENGKLKSKIIGVSGAKEDQLILSLQYNAEMLIRNGIVEWSPDERSLYPAYFYRDNSVTPCYPKKQYFCHGNGKPYIILTCIQDSLDIQHRSNEFIFFDPEGNRLENNQVVNNLVSKGTKYAYFNSGALEWKYEDCDGRNCKKTTRWYEDSTLRSIEYNSGKGRDSIIFYKQLIDTLIEWKFPMNFEWNNQGKLNKVSHPNFELYLNQTGGVHYIKFNNSSWVSYEKYKDDRMKWEHFGALDDLGFPHGQWYGVNALGDTVYDINFVHGWLNGAFRYTNSIWEQNATHVFNMGKQRDSSLIFNKGTLREIQYFSETGKLIKKAWCGDKGQIRYIDTLISENNFFRLKEFHPDGWITAIGTVDTSKKILHLKRFSAPDLVSREAWNDYRNRPIETKDYFLETDILKQHWKREGYIRKTIESSESDQAPKETMVDLVLQWTYDEQGNLIKKERWEGGKLVEEQ